MNIGEACLAVENALVAIELAAKGLQSHGVSCSRWVDDYIFDFQSARALIRAEPGILWIRVEADEIPICHGTKVLMEAELRRHADGMPTHVLWLEAHGEPFATIMSYKKAGGVTDC